MDIVRNAAGRGPPSLVLALLTALTFAATTAYAQKYSVLVLQGLPGGSFTSAVALNNAGQVAGTADDGNGGEIQEFGGPYAVIWNKGVPTYLAGSSIQFFASVGGINNAGLVAGSVFEIAPFVAGAGFYSSYDDLACHCQRYQRFGVVNGAVFGFGCVFIGPDISGGPAYGLQLLSGPFGTGAYTANVEPLGINNAGEIVGISYSENLSGTDFTSASRATRWSNGRSSRPRHSGRSEQRSNRHQRPRLDDRVGVSRKQPLHARSALGADDDGLRSGDPRRSEQHRTGYQYRRRHRRSGAKCLGHLARGVMDSQTFFGSRPQHRDRPEQRSPLTTTSAVGNELIDVRLL